MKLTSNYNLKKPEGTDVVNIDDLNENADIIDVKLKYNEEKINTLGANKADLIDGKVPTSQLPDIEVPVKSVNGKIGSVVLTKSDIGLGNVDNTADSTKSVLSATKLATPRQINGVNFDGTANIIIQDNTKAPINHASTGTAYGVGDANNYGHVKVRNDLVGTETSGVTVSPAQIKALNDKTPVSIIEYVTTSKTWTVPPNKTMLSVVLIGGGGGGGGGGSAVIDRDGGGGGGGIIQLLNMKVIPGQTYTIVIGAGGSGASTGGTGGAGGTTSFGTIISAHGGSGGTGGSSGTGASAGGKGGSGGISTGAGGGNGGSSALGGAGGGGGGGSGSTGAGGSGSASTGGTAGGGGSGSGGVGAGGTGGSGASAGGTGSSGSGINGGNGGTGGSASVNTGCGGGGGGGAGSGGGSATTGGKGAGGGNGGSGIAILLYW